MAETTVRGPAEHRGWGSTGWSSSAPAALLAWLQLLLYDVHGWGWFPTDIVRTYWKDSSRIIQVVEHDTSIQSPWFAHMGFIGVIFCLLWGYILSKAKSFAERAVCAWMLAYCVWQLIDRLYAGNLRSDGIAEWPLVYWSFLGVILVCAAHEYAARHRTTPGR